MLHMIPTWLGGKPKPVPTFDEVKQERQREVEFALLDAEAENERSRHTVNMLRERLLRLSK